METHPWEVSEKDTCSGGIQERDFLPAVGEIN